MWAVKVNIALTPHPLIFKWNDGIRVELHNIFNNEEMNDQMDKTFVHSNDNEIDTFSLANNFTETFNKADSKVTPFKKMKKNFHKMGTNSVILKQKWFDNNCYRLKKELRNSEKLLSTQPNNPFVRHLFFTKKKEYKKLTRKLKRNFHSNILDKITILADSIPKAFRTLLTRLMLGSCWLCPRLT
jgi:hypothetical protein